MEAVRMRWRALSCLCLGPCGGPRELGDFVWARYPCKVEVPMYNHRWIFTLYTASEAN